MRCLKVYILLMVVSLFVYACTTDYRTDYEKNNDIELTEYQIEQRKATRKAIRESRMRTMDEQERLMRMRRIMTCPTGNYLDCWW